MMGTMTNMILPEENYYTEETKKTRIIIGNIPVHDMSFVNGWKIRYNGQYKRTCHYTIDRAGKIYSHIPIKNYSSFLDIDNIDKESISIGLLNIGWVKHNSTKTKWIDWKGQDIDIPASDLIQKQWREHTYWCPYSDKQIKSLVKLLKKTTDDCGIERLMIDSNTLLINKKEHWPISFRSNYLYYKTDVTPAFPFELVINGIS